MPVRPSYLLPKSDPPTGFTLIKNIYQIVWNTTATSYVILQSLSTRLSLFSVVGRVYATGSTDAAA